MKIKIQGGTANSSSVSLCQSCRSATVAQMERGHVYIRCHRFDTPVLGKVVECSDYLDKSLPSLQDMKMIAWELSTDSKKKEIGFNKPNLKPWDWAERFDDI